VAHIPQHIAESLRRRRPPPRDGRGRLLPGHALRSKIPRPAYPAAIEAAYAKALVSIVDEIYDLARPLLDALPRTDEVELKPAQETVERFGLRVAIENPAGSIRRWTDSDGSQGETVMKWSYGEIVGFTGSDGEGVDVYLGPEEKPEWIYIVEQMAKSTGFEQYDEQKVMIGWPSADAAVRAYLEQYDDPRFYGGLTVMSPEDFKAQLVACDGGRIVHGAERMDESAAVIRMRHQVDRARRSLSDPHRVRRLQNLAARYAKSTSEFSRARLAAQAKAAFGVDVSILDRSMPKMMEAWVHENVTRITSIENEALDQVAAIVAKAYASNDPINVARATAAKKIEERFGVSARKARFLAVDQIGKLNGQVNRARQIEMGMTRFRWWTRRDSRVRHSHRRLHGDVFSWDDLPINERGEKIYPGSDFRCRCGAEPVFDEMKAVVSFPYVGAPLVNYTR
jgi:SPP1 gp7 family putative phage head morphogenesis protein